MQPIQAAIGGHGDNAEGQGVPAKLYSQLAGNHRDKGLSLRLSNVIKDKLDNSKKEEELTYPEKVTERNTLQSIVREYSHGRRQ